MILPIEIRFVDGKGLGVFAARDISQGEVIEACPVILLSEADRENIEPTPLDNYIYPWKEGDDACMVLGYGSLINHKFGSNANWHQDYETKQMVYTAVKNIAAGEEITVNYNGDPDDPTPINWFEVR